MKNCITIDGSYEESGITIHSVPEGFVVTYADGGTALFKTTEEVEHSLTQGWVHYFPKGSKDE